jgi:hypothetical protein
MRQTAYGAVEESFNHGEAARAAAERLSEPPSRVVSLSLPRIFIITDIRFKLRHCAVLLLQRLPVYRWMKMSGNRGSV